MQTAVLPMSQLHLDSDSQQQQHQQHQQHQQQHQQHQQQQKPTRKHARSSSSVESPQLKKKQSISDLSQKHHPPTPPPQMPKHDFICIITPQASVQYTSPSVVQFLGYQPSDLIGNTVTDYIHPEDVPRFMAGLQSSMTNGSQLHTSIRIRLKSGDHHSFDGLGRPFYNEAAIPGPSNAAAAAAAASAMGSSSGSGSGGDCKGIVLILRPRLNNSKSPNASPPSTNNSSLWLRRHTARMQEGKVSSTEVPHLEPLVSSASSATGHDGSANNTPASGPQGGAPSFNLSVFAPPPPIGSSSQSTPATANTVSPLYVDPSANVSTHTLIVDPTPSSQPSSTVTTSHPGSSIPSATISSTTTSFFDEPLMPPYSATATEFMHPPADLPSPRYSYSYGARSYSVCDVPEPLSALPFQLDDSSSTLPNDLASPYSPVTPFGMRTMSASAASSVGHSKPATATPSIYSPQSTSAADSSTHLGDSSSSTAANPGANPGAYWDNTANSEIVSPQYYYQQTPSSFLHHQYPVSAHPVSNPYHNPHQPALSAVAEFNDRQARGKSYSLPGTLDVPRPSVVPSSYGYEDRQAIDFSGYSMTPSGMKPPNPSLLGGNGTAGPRRKSRSGGSQHHHHHHPSFEGFRESRHVCDECGAMESPEWRKGPKGPKTLCNACGLRWAKKNRREEKREKR